MIITDYIKELFIILQQKMYTDMTGINRELARLQAESDKKSHESAYRKKYALRALKNHKKQINKTIQYTRTRKK